MKRARVLVASASCLLTMGGFDSDVALARSTCSCPAGMVDGGNGLCQAPPHCPAHFHLGGGECWEDHAFPHHRHFPAFFPPPIAAVCKSNALATSPTALAGEVATTQQQRSMSIIAGVLQGRRDSLQTGSSPSQRITTAALAYAPANRDGSSLTSNTTFDARWNPLADRASSPVGSSSGPVWATWFEGMGDGERRSALNENDIGRTQAAYATHAGMDATWTGPFRPGDYVVVGVVTSYSTINVDLANATRMRLEGPGVGVYAMYLLGGFSVDVTSKFDFLSLKEDLGALALPNASIGTTTAGIAGNVQYKRQFDWGFVEPTAGFTYSRIMFGNNAATIGQQDGSTLRLQAGVRVGGTVLFDGFSVEPALGVLAYSDVIADNTAIQSTDASVPVTPTDKGLVRAAFDPEVNFNFQNGYNAYIRCEIRVGRELTGGSAKVGVRKDF